MFTRRKFFLVLLSFLFVSVFVFAVQIGTVSADGGVSFDSSCRDDANCSCDRGAALLPVVAALAAASPDTGVVVRPIRGVPCEPDAPIKLPIVPPDPRDCPDGGCGCLDGRAMPVDLLADDGGSPPPTDPSPCDPPAPVPIDPEGGEGASFSVGR